MAKHTTSIPVNKSLLNVITPMNLSIQKNSLEIGENIGRVYGVIKYPQKVDMGWLSKVTNIPGTIANVSFRPIDNGALISAISKSITQNRVAAESAKDPLARQRAEKAAEDGERIMLQIDQHGETVGLMSIAIMPLAPDEKSFTKTCRRIESTMSVLKCKIRSLANLQEDGLKHMSPTYPLNERVAAIIERIVPLSTVMGGFPFASSGFNDGTGYYIGRDSMGGLVIVDTWKRGEDRTNSNFVITGVAGVGKSTVLKHIALSEYMKGTKLIFIDPESEMKELCRALNGDWINIAGGAKGGGMINPLQIRPVPRDDEDEDAPLFRDEGNGMGDMALYLQTLEVYFKLKIPSLDDMQRAILKQSIIELYNQWGIFWETDIAKLKNTDFPIMENLHSLIEEKANQHPDQPIYTNLALLLHDMAKGGDSFLCNGHTSIEAGSRCIVLDTSALQNTSDETKRSTYYNTTTWCWEQMSRDRNERVMLFCDEAYLLIDPQVPQTLVFLRNVEKRSRKYESALAIISHSIVDFLSPEVKMYGQALLDIPCVKVLMGTDGQNLMETKNLYSLTDAEVELLAAKRRGHALFIIGSKRLHVNFEIPAYKFEYMGKAGGR